MIWRRLLALTLAAFAAISVAPAGASESPSASPDRQILVMVRHPPDHYRANGAYGGSYGDELARNGLYARLYETQFATERERALKLARSYFTLAWQYARGTSPATRRARSASATRRATASAST